MYYDNNKTTGSSTAAGSEREGREVSREQGFKFVTLVSLEPLVYFILCNFTKYLFITSYVDRTENDNDNEWPSPPALHKWQRPAATSQHHPLLLANVTGVVFAGFRETRHPMHYPTHHYERGTHETRKKGPKRR